METAEIRHEGARRAKFCEPAQNAAQRCNSPDDSPPPATMGLEKTEPAVTGRHPLRTLRTGSSNNYVGMPYVYGRLPLGIYPSL
jgi:hypothetical protein